MEHNITMDGLAVIVNFEERTFRVKEFNVKGGIEARTPDPYTQNTNGNFTVPFRLMDWGSAVQQCNRARAASFNPVIGEEKLRIESAKQLILQEFPGRPPLKAGFLQSLTRPPHFAEQAVVEKALAELIAEGRIVGNGDYLFLKE
jgi:hypothetical protein